MPTSYPPEIAQLEQVVRSIATLERTDAIMQYHSFFQAAHNALTAEPDSGRRQEYLQFIEQLVPHAGLGRVFVLSFLVDASQDPERLWDLYRTVFQQPDFTMEQRHFFYWQLITRHSTLLALPALDPASVYPSLLESYRKAVRFRAAWIEPADRDADSIVVITNQLLGPAHAPTADCLDYCRILQQCLNKKVLLINTADMPWMLELPYYNPFLFNYLKEYSDAGQLNFKGESIDFYQCRKPMPNIEETRAILGTVLKRKPAFVLSLGHSNVTPDLCSDFVTVATMPFGTNLPFAKSNLFILPRARRHEDLGVMERWKIAAEQIIETEYTFRLPERTVSLTRAELGLPANAFVIVIVGNRLDDEITGTVAAELSELLTELPRTFIAFAGVFGKFPDLTRRNPILAERSAFLGYREDILAVYECCDAYFNPPRYGGGSSAAFAQAMGLPVLTRPSGDVANSAGAPFIFATFDDIKAFIGRALLDADMRRQWAGIARARFNEISDREGMLRGIVEEVTAKAGIRRSRRV